MYIRCPDCRASTWIDLVPAAKDAGGALTCKSCSRSHVPAPDNALVAPGSDPYQTALNFAEQHGIDLPSAYSVLLGLISLDGARELLRTPAPAPAPAPVPAPASASARRSSGHAAPDPDALTAEALGLGRGSSSPMPRRSASGNRQGVDRAEPAKPEPSTVAERLARRYKLRPELAREVAERRQTLQAALMQQPRDARPARAGNARELAWQRLLIPALAFLLAVTLIGVHAWREWRGYVHRGRELESAPLAPVQRDVQAHSTLATKQGVAEPGVNVTFGDAGEITQIVGPSAQAVLVTFCRERGAAGSGCDPLELAAPIPAHAGVRIGLFRDYTDLSRTFALRIARDTNSRRWRAGDGLRPIVFIAADQMRLTEPRIPLTTLPTAPATVAPPAPTADAAVRSDIP